MQFTLDDPSRPVDPPPEPKNTGRRPVLIALLGVLVVGAIFALNYTVKHPIILNAPAPAATGPGAPSFDVARIDPKGNLVVAGRGQPNATVVILDGDKEIGRVKADGRGEWVYVPDAPVAPGARQFSLKTLGADGTDLISQNVVVMSVPERNGEVLIVEQSRDGGRTRVLQGPGAAGTGKLGVEAIDYAADGTFSMSGNAEPGATVQVYLDNALVGRAVADDKGLWRMEPKSKAGEGPHVIRVDRLGPNVLARVEVPFTLDLTQANMPPGSVTVVKGNGQWRIARPVYGQGVVDTVILEVNQDQIKNPALIYPGQVFKLPVKDRL